MYKGFSSPPSKSQCFCMVILKIKINDLVTYSLTYTWNLRVEELL